MDEANVRVVVRLEWVHASAAFDRWTEEGHLLREESRRIAVSFQKAASSVLSDMHAVSASWPALAAANPLGAWFVRGFRAAAHRRAFGLERLAVDAVERYISIGGSRDLGMAPPEAAVPPPEDIVMQ